MTDNVIELPSPLYRPEMSYETDENGRLVSEQHALALDYIQGLQEQMDSAGNSILIDIIGKEMLAFTETLPATDEEKVIETLIED